MLTPLITITLSYISGLILGCGFLYFPVTITALMLSGLAISILLTRKKKLSLRHVLIISASCSLGAVFYVASAAYFPENHYNRTIVFDKEKHEVFGRIITPLDRDPGRTSFIIKAQKIDNTPISGKMRVSARDEKISAGYGDLVRLSGLIFQPTGFANPKGFYYPEHLARQGVYANVSVRDAGGVELIRPGKGIFRTIQDWRENIRQSIRDKTTGPGSAIMQAMVLGEEGGLTDEVRDRFMAAGVTHILSISGSHLGLVALLCFGLIRGMLFLLPEKQYNRLTIHADPKKIAAWLTIPPVVFYALLAGGQIATLRSLVMILAAMTALVLDRENSLMRSLAAAALLILAASPQALFDISFQLSYISVLSIGYVVTLSNELSIQAKGLFGKIRNSADLSRNIPGRKSRHRPARGVLFQPVLFCRHYFEHAHRPFRGRGDRAARAAFRHPVAVY